MTRGRPGRLPLVAGREIVLRATYRSLAGLVPHATSLCSSGGVLVVELTGPGEVDVGVLSALARLRLAAARDGVELRLRAPEEQLRQLAELAGLCEVLRLEG